MDRRSFPLDSLTSIGIGGPADRLVEPRDEEALRAALRDAAEREITVRALGGGRNLLVSDAGVEGTVVSLGGLDRAEADGTLLVAQAGVSTRSLISLAVSNGLAGLECLVGVPGTIGGAVRMNAGGAHGEIGERIEWVRGFSRTGEEWRFSGEACGFRYRGSRLAGAFVTEVAVRLRRSKRDLRARVREIFQKKRGSQPLFAATSGCMFKNPTLPGGESAGWLLDRAKLKGLTRGGARYSTLHANFVENRGDATCRDVVDLLREGHRRVRDRFGVNLELEVEVWSRAEEGALQVA